MEAAVPIKLLNNSFALRHGERVAFGELVEEGGVILMVMLRSVSFPDGEYQRTSGVGGRPVEQSAVLACHRVDGLWQWLQLEPQTKDAIGGLLFDNGADRDVWHRVSVVRVVKED